MHTVPRGLGRRGRFSVDWCSGRSVFWFSSCMFLYLPIGHPSDQLTLIEQPLTSI